MRTLHLDAGQLPIDGTANRIIWRVETNDRVIDLRYTPRGWSAWDFDGEPEGEYNRVDFVQAIHDCAPYMRGDLYNPNTNRFVGLFRKA